MRAQPRVARRGSALRKRCRAKYSAGKSLITRLNRSAGNVVTSSGNARVESRNGSPAPGVRESRQQCGCIVVSAGEAQPENVIAAGDFPLDDPRSARGRLESSGRAERWNSSGSQLAIEYW